MDTNKIAIGQTITDDEFNNLGIAPVGQTLTNEQFKSYGSAVSEPTTRFQQVPVGGIISDNEFNEMETTGEKSSGWLKEYAKDVGSAFSRTAGVVLGALNSPLALGWGAANAKNIEPEKFKKMPYWKQEVYSFGKGLESAWEGISKKGEWGTMYGEYFHGTTGKSIEQTLPDKLKWTAPTLEFLANIVSDPLVSIGQAGRIASLKMTPGAKGFTKSFPKGLVAELEKFDQLQAAEKQVLQKQLMDALKNRKDYMSWWNEQIKTNPKMLQETGTPLIKPSPVKPYMTAPQQAIAGQPQREFATIGKGDIPSEFQKLTQSAKDAPHPSISRFKREKAVSAFNKSRTEAGLNPISLESVETAAKNKGQIRLDKINVFRKSKGLELINERSVKVGAAKYSTTAKSTAGLGYGIEEDENGDIRYNVKKGLAGALIVAGGVSVANTKGVKKFAQTMGENPAWAKVHGMIGDKTRTFTLSGLIPRINTKIFDRFGVLRKSSPEAYKKARTFSSYKDVAKKEFDELKDAFNPVKKDEVIITDYIDAHRAMTRAERGLKNPNGVTYTDAKNAITEIEEHYATLGKDPEVLKNALSGFQSWTHDNILKPAFESGIISKKSYDSIVKNNEWYAAFDVLEKLPADINKIPSKIGGEYFSVSNQEFIKSMVGTEKKIANPIESTVKKFMQAKATIAKNKVAGTFIDDPVTSKILRPVARNPKEFKIMKQQGLDPVIQGAWDKNKFDTINRFKDGKVERYITDKVYADAMKQLTPYQAPKVVQGLNAIFRKSATTVYLPFTISNAMRDGLMAYATSPTYKSTRPDKFIKDWTKGFWEGAKHEFLGKSDLATEYIGHGGGFGYVGNLRQAKLAKSELFKKGVLGKTVTVIKSPLDLIEKVSATIELAPRLGVFNRAKTMNMLPDDAVLAAKQSTIDFNRAGTMTKVVNQFVPFLSARVGARVTFASALKNNPKGTLGKTFTAAVLPGMGAYAWNRMYFSDLYDDIPESIKQNYFTIIYSTDKNKYGKTVPKYFAIAKGDLGQMAFNPIEFGMDEMLKKDPGSTSAFIVNYLSDVSPVEFAREGKPSLSKAASGLLPPIAKGFAEDWANLKFYHGTEIVPYYMGKSKPPELQYKENTPVTYKWLGKKIGVAPLRLQNFASNILAGYGREGLDPSAMLRGLTGRIVKTRGGEIQNRAWTAIADIEHGYVYTRAYAEELIKDGDRRGAIKLINEWNKGLNNQLREYNKQFGKHGLNDKGGIRRSYTFSPEKTKNLLMKRKRTRSPLERRINIK